MWPLAATIVGIVVVIVLRMPLGELLNRVKGISKKGVVLSEPVEDELMEEEVEEVAVEVRELNVEGEWTTRFEEDGKSYAEKVILHQDGQKVTADISLQQDGEEILYSFEGTFRDRILSGTYEATDEANFERGTILLKYTRKGTFVGRNAFLSRTSENLVSSPYEWTLVKRLSR